MDANSMILDTKALIGTVIVGMAAANSWIESANEYAAFAVTIIGGCVGIATLWYTIERARKIRKERKDDDG